MREQEKVRKQEELRRRSAEQKQKEEAKKKAEQEALLKAKKMEESLKRSSAPPEMSPMFRYVVQTCPRLEKDLATVKPAASWDRPQMTPIQKAFERLLCMEGRIEGKTTSNWKPQGKSAWALLVSLATHLFSKYSTPQFLWNILTADDVTYGSFRRMVVHIAGGGSLKSFLTMSAFPVPLTKKMIHDFLKSPADYSIMKALRSAQVMNLGGTVRLRDALMQTSWGTGLGTKLSEEFWVTVVQWFANQALLDPARIAPMCDYINHCFLTIPGYTMKGRTALTVIRGMEAWHHELARTRPDRGYKGQLTYVPSGFKEVDFDFSREVDGNVLKEIWRFREILTAKDLFDEGKRQGHCVGSYAHSIESRRISIWILTKEDNEGNWAMLTLEVVNATGQVVQARGRFNRPATTHEMNLINRWYGVCR